jgi:hypothetical protein
MQAFVLKPHVRACRDGAAIVFLDLRRDRYWAIALSVAPRIPGLSDDATGEKGAARLLALDLIEASAEEPPQLPHRHQSPVERLLLPDRVEASTSDWAQFLLSCAGASRWLGSRRLDRILRGFQERKQRLATRRGDPAEVAGVFERLRPFYPQTRVCLFESVALMDFMLARGLSPSLVLGVRTGPFAAHCWLELDGMLVADTSDHCASFTPIAWA